MEYGLIGYSIISHIITLLLKLFDERVNKFWQRFITLLILLDAALIGFQVEVEPRVYYNALQAVRIIDQVFYTTLKESLKKINSIADSTYYICN